MDVFEFLIRDYRCSDIKVMQSLHRLGVCSRTLYNLLEPDMVLLFRLNHILAGIGDRFGQSIGLQLDNLRDPVEAAMAYVLRNPRSELMYEWSQVELRMLLFTDSTDPSPAYMHLQVSANRKQLRIEVQKHVSFLVRDDAPKAFPKAELPALFWSRMPHNQTTDAAFDRPDYAMQSYHNNPCIWVSVLFCPRGAPWIQFPEWLLLSAKQHLRYGLVRDVVRNGLVQYTRSDMYPDLFEDPGCSPDQLPFDNLPLLIRFMLDQAILFHTTREKAWIARYGGTKLTGVRALPISISLV